MTQITDESKISGKISLALWFVLFLLAIACSFCLFLCISNNVLYLQNNEIPVLDRNNDSHDTVALIGKDDSYFAVLPIQQIQLTESIAPIRILEVQIAFSLKLSTDIQKVSAKLPLIQDLLISYFRTLTLDELQEIGRLFYLKEAILEQVNSALFPFQVQDIFFQKIVVKEGI